MIGQNITDGWFFFIIVVSMVLFVYGAGDHDNVQAWTMGRSFASFQGWSKYRMIGHNITDGWFFFIIVVSMVLFVFGADDHDNVQS